MSLARFKQTSTRLKQSATPLIPVAWVILFALIVFGSIVGGLWLRGKTWDTTNAARFNYDINNGFNWGMRANELGYFSIYERLGAPAPGKEHTDYAPLRLGVMSYWVRGMYDQRGDPVPRSRDRSRAFHAFLLNLNTSMGLLTAIGSFLIARHLRRRDLGTDLPPPDLVLADTDPTINRDPPTFWQGTWIALFVAILTWINPLILFNAHGWPQWDIWPMPFFLFALYACFRRWWLVAGLLLGLGATLKGQILMVAWVLPIWALMLGDWRGTIKLIVGIPTGIAIVGLPWIVSVWDPTHEATRAFDLFDRTFNKLGLLFMLVQVGLAILAPLVIWRRIYPTLIAFAFVTSAWLTMRYYGGTDYWLQSAFGVGTWNYSVMFMGPTSNLPALLVHYGWNNLQEVMFSIGQRAVTMKELLLSTFVLLCLACAAIGAVRYRQRDPRAIIALCLPWLLFYAIPAQIHERYLFFFVACSAMFLICSTGWFLLAMSMTVLGLAAIFHATLDSNNIPKANWSQIPPLPWDNTPVELWGFIRYLVTPLHPGIAWGLLLAVAAFLIGVYLPRKQR